MGLVIVDLEATCWNEDKNAIDFKYIPRNEHETIEIGAVYYNNGTIVSEFQAFIKPVVHPELSKYCLELTHITQDDVNTAEIFPIVFARFVEWVKAQSGHERDLRFASWRKYDLRQLGTDCSRHKITMRFNRENHLNLKKVVPALMDWQGTHGLGGALTMLGITFEGIPHRGIDDARNTAKIWHATIEHIKKSG